MDYIELSIPFDSNLCITCLPMIEYEGFNYTDVWSSPEQGDKNYTEWRVNESQSNRVANNLCIC